jgi:hypothetical protein
MKIDSVRESILAELPLAQREEAAKRYDWAVYNGWEHIGLWTGNEPADASDLVGVPPGVGFVRFVPMKLPEE